MLTQPPPALCTFQSQEFSCYAYKLTSNTKGEGGVILLLQSAKHDVKVIGFNCTTSEELVLTDFQKPDSNVTIAAGEYKPLNGNLTDPLPLPCWNADGTKISAQDAGQYYRGRMYMRYIDLETNTEHNIVGYVSSRID